MQKIGKLELLSTRTLIIPFGDDAWIDVDAKGWEMRFHLIFNNDSGATNVKISAGDGHATMEFNNWGNSLGAAMKKPLELAKHANGKKIYFIGASHSIGEKSGNSTFKIDLQFMMDV